MSESGEERIVDLHKYTDLSSRYEMLNIGLWSHNLLYTYSLRARDRIKTTQYVLSI